MSVTCCSVRGQLEGQTALPERARPSEAGPSFFQARRLRLAGHIKSGPAGVTVASYNIYLGADLTPILQARYTDRDVVLVRSRPGGPADVSFGGRVLRFGNTHLEAYHPQIRAAPASELGSVLARLCV